MILILVGFALVGISLCDALVGIPVLRCSRRDIALRCFHREIARDLFGGGMSVLQKQNNSVIVITFYVTSFIIFMAALGFGLYLICTERYIFGFTTVGIACLIWLALNYVLFGQNESSKILK
jgi:hypothetical protein